MNASSFARRGTKTHHEEFSNRYKSTLASLLQGSSQKNMLQAVAIVDDHTAVKFMPRSSFHMTTTLRSMRESEKEKETSRNRLVAPLWTNEKFLDPIPFSAIAGAQLSWLPFF